MAPTFRYNMRAELEGFEQVCVDRANELLNLGELWQDLVEIHPVCFSEPRITALSIDDIMFKCPVENQAPIQVDVKTFEDTVYSKLVCCK